MILGKFVISLLIPLKLHEKTEEDKILFSAILKQWLHWSSWQLLDEEVKGGIQTIKYLWIQDNRSTEQDQHGSPGSVTA